MKRLTTTLLASIFLLTACARTATAAVTTIPLPKETPSAKNVIEGAHLNECKNCHTDKQHLIDTARPEVVVEKESSGTG